MGKSLYEGSASAKDLYDRAAKVLPFDLRKACFEGPAELLTETRVCQPALYVQGYAIAHILKERGKLGDLKACLGLSLGELTAYAFAGVWDFETGLKVVAERGRLMQLACDQTKGGMAAVIGGTREDIFKLCAAFDIDAANFNCPGQVAGSAPRPRAAAVMRGSSRARRARAARPALSNWCGPGRAGGGRSSRRSDAWTIRRPLSRQISASRPTRVSGAPTACASASITARASSRWRAQTTGRSALMIPAFSQAILGRPGPSISRWS